MHLLIDTNCWTDLLKNSIEEDNLYQLIAWVNAGKAFILVPEVLLKEWNKQKIFQLKELKTQNKKAFENVDNTTKEILKANYSNIEKKAVLIDELFSKGLHINITKNVDAEVSSRWRQNMAPFHNNRNSHSDAYLFLSSIDYLKRQKIPKLLFATRNPDDFGDPDNPRETLHPDLLFHEVSINYYGQIGLAISKLKKELGDSFINSDDTDIDYISQFQLIEGPKKYKLLDQLYLSLDRYSDQIPFIPTHILVKVFPIKINDAKYSYSYHSSFQINSNNDELLEFFKAFKIGKSNTLKFEDKKFISKVKNSKTKVLTILHRLNHNLIYNFSTIGSHQEVDIRLKDKTSCDCIRCSYNRLDFYRAYSLLIPSPQEDDRETLKQAYIHYQFGQLQTALKLYYHVYEKSKGSEKTILAFICLYNLKHIKRYIRGHFSALDQDAEIIIRKVNKISLKKATIAAFHQSPFINEVINWISDNHFFNDAHQSISDVLEKIRDHYNSQLRGGFSSNSNFDILVSHFAELDQFLDRNFILFNNFSEFESVANKFLEGLLMIYSFNKHQSKRIEYINEYLLLKIVSFTKRETIIKYYKRIHLTSLNYKTSTKTEPPFENIGLRFLSDYPKLKALSEAGQKLDFLFWEKYHRIFENILLILTLSPKKIKLDEITRALLKVIEDETFLRKFETNCVADFIRDKGNLISDEVFKEFIPVCIKNPKLHETEIFSAIRKQLTNSHRKLVINDSETFTEIKRNFVEKCSSCKSFHHKDILIHIIPILSERYKREIRESIVDLLNIEFQPDLYYMMAMTNGIDNKLFYKKYRDLVQPPKDTNATRHFFNRGEAFSNSLSNLINLAYKNNIDLTSPDYQIYKGISNYYDWLLDFEGFDYKKFEPLWILEYQTHYYFKKIFSSRKVIENLLPFLRKTKHAHLSNLLIRFGKYNP